ncbi:calcium/proton exchanger [Tanacetum coccineum]
MGINSPCCTGYKNWPRSIASTALAIPGAHDILNKKVSTERQGNIGEVDQLRRLKAEEKLTTGKFLYKMVTFIVDLYHDGLFVCNPLRLVLDEPLSFFYVIPGVPMNIGLRPICNDEQLNDFVQALFENDFHLDMYTEHQGYDVLEMINDDRHCEDKSDSDFEDVEKGDNLDDVKDIVDFQTEGEENVDIPKLSIDDLWLNKLVGKGRFVGEMEDPILGLKGRFFVEQNDPDENFVEPKYKDKGKVGEGSSDKDLGKRSAGGSSDKGKRKLGEDRSEPSKVSQATKKRWRKKKLEEKENIKNAVDCPFRLWASWMSIEKSFQIKTLYPDHKCCRNYNLGSLVTYRWIAEHYAREIIDNPWVSYNYMQNSIRSKFMINVSFGQCKRAKRAALFDHEGGLIDHYSKIWQYRQAVLDSNSGSTCHIDLEEKEDGLTYFKRFYVCFFGLKASWLEGCRKVIGLDGCFLTHTCKGQLLTAMGRDANNQMFPIAWAVVGVENKNNWTWFLSLLSDDLNLDHGARLTVISDGHKGLLEAVKIWLLDAEHRQCTRHIYANFKKKWSGLQFKRLFWKSAARSLNEQFLEVMEEIKALDENAYSCFNSKILSARGKPFITMLEDIRVYIMQRVWFLNKTAMELNDSITPFARRHLEFMKIRQRKWVVYASEFQEVEEHAEMMDKEAFADMVKKDAENKAKDEQLWREAYEEDKYWEEYAVEFKDWEFREEEENRIGIMLSVDDEHIIGNKEPVTPAEQTHVITSASSAPVDEQPETSQDPSTEKAGSSAPID